MPCARPCKSSSTLLRLCLCHLCADPGGVGDAGCVLLLLLPAALPIEVTMGCAPEALVMIVLFKHSDE